MTPHRASLEMSNKFDGQRRLIVYSFTRFYFICTILCFLPAHKRIPFLTNSAFVMAGIDLDAYQLVTSNHKISENQNLL